MKLKFLEGLFKSGNSFPHCEDIRELESPAGESTAVRQFVQRQRERGFGICTALAQIQNPTVSPYRRPRVVHLLIYKTHPRSYTNPATISVQLRDRQIRGIMNHDSWFSFFRGLEALALGSRHSIPARSLAFNIQTLVYVRSSLP